jgi:hypothetical protein
MTTTKNIFAGHIRINDSKKVIEITKRLDKESAIFGSAARNFVNEAKKENPGYTVRVMTKRKNSLSDRIKMKDILYYVEKHSGKESKEWKALEELRGTSVKELKEIYDKGYIFEVEETPSFPTIKKWFFNTYTELDKKNVDRKNRINAILAEAADNAASA